MAVPLSLQKMTRLDRLEKPILADRRAQVMRPDSDAIAASHERDVPFGDLRDQRQHGGFHALVERRFLDLGVVDTARATADDDARKILQQQGVGR